LQGKRSRRDAKRYEKRARLTHADDVVYRKYEKTPVSEGEVVEVRITETNTENVGIARIGLYKILVPGTRIGDVVKVRILETREREAVGEILD